MTEVCSIASGSNGNCYYIGNKHEAILIDAGISCKQILIRMAERNLVPEKIKAIFISHEHIDHVRGARVLANKLNIPVFFTPGTWHNLAETLRPAMYRYISIGQTIAIGSINVHPFAKMHDASEPCSFRIETAGNHIGVITDLGTACQFTVNELSKCNCVFIESNYDEDMLWRGPYPWPLKKRIADIKGHLSNKQSFELISQNSNADLKLLILSHLSGENNTPQLAAKAFETLESNLHIEVASRHQAGNVFQLEPIHANVPVNYLDS